MKRLFLCLAISSVAATAAVAQSPSWLVDGKPMQRLVEGAKRDGSPAADATTTLIGAGRSPSETVQTVARVYGGCGDLKDAVRAGVSAAPQDTQFIVEAVAALETCVCTEGDVWPQMRLDGRLRIGTQRQGVEFASASACVAAAAESAVAAAPDQADGVLKGVIAGARRSGKLVDSVGQIGVVPDTVPAQENWKRGDEASERCSTDLRLDDDPRYDARFAAKSASADVVAQLGAPCDGANDLLIDGIATAARTDSAVVLRNDTDRNIDLDAGGYTLDVYRAGAESVGNRVALTGLVGPGKSFVVAPDSASASVISSANQITRSARVSPGDAVALRRASYEADCSNVPTAVGVIANQLGTAGSAWLQETANRYSDNGKNLRAVDSIGQVGAPAQTWLGDRAGRPFAVSRINDAACQGRLDFASSFSTTGNWQTQDGVSADRIGSGTECVGSANDLVISEYQNDTDNYRVVEILNNTSASIDMASRGYLLEVYAQSANTPTSTIALKGVLEPGQSMVVVDDSAPEAIRAKSTMVSAELRQPEINALVLRRIEARGNRNCEAEVVAVTRDVGPTPVVFIAGTVFAPSREPRNDDPLIDGNSGGQLASPN